MKRVGYSFMIAATLVVVFLAAPPPAFVQDVQTPHAATPIPDYVAYWHVFHHIARLKAKASELATPTQDHSALRYSVQRQAGLSPERSSMLEEIALECERQVAQQDEAARRIIAEFRSRYPGGRLPAGMAPPPPPPQLRAMQEVRNSLILQARNRLQQALGNDAFAKFDEFVKQSVNTHVKPISASGESAEGSDRRVP